MKKLLLVSAVSAVLFGAATASQAGVRFGLDFGLPLPVPPLPGMIISQPAPVITPAPCDTPPPVVYTAPAQVYCPPPVVYTPPTVHFGIGSGYHNRYYPRHYGRDWDHHRGGYGYHGGYHGRRY